MGSKILIAALGANGRGDLFNDRMKDVIVSLGYEPTRVNVHKSGREIDIHGKHRVENREIIAECKAQSAPISGSDLNKFAGVLQVERESCGNLVGYFISLSGFSGPALVQEEEFQERRFEVLGPDQVLNHLQIGKLICPKEEAYAVAAASNASQFGSEISLSGEVDLVAYDSGWAWLTYFTRAGEKVAIALIHANGYLLSSRLAKAIQAKLGKEYKGLTLLSPPPGSPLTAEAERAYKRFIVEEYGALTLEGVPVDKYSSSTVHQVEALYVPPRVSRIPDSSDLSPLLSHSSKNLPISEALASEKRIAILAGPGSGKSTLIKRLAVAYVDSDRKKQVPDSLPDERWLPVVLRGRDIHSVGESTILDLVYDVPRRAERPWLIESFKELLNQRLQSGNVILLVDGIDEIAGESDRHRFAHQLRTFVSTHPLVQLVVTSREAGFRSVAGTISTYCTPYQLSEFSDHEISKLTFSWFKEMRQVGESEENAEEVIFRILSSDRIRRLAANPLLLTTLLYVQRWAGEIPRRRTVLYDKAIELLLMTWNVEGHAPLNLDEVLPQLAFLAFELTRRGEQRFTSKEAEKILLSARRAMPEVLAYTTVSPSDLLKGVELRSSLIVRAGYEIRDGQATSIYEFRHLTFQEYLAALAVAREWTLQSADSKPVEILGPVLMEPIWAEVVPLASVLLGRRGGGLVTRLCDYIEQIWGMDDIEDEESDVRFSQRVEVGFVLQTCIEDEVQLAPPEAERALRLIIELNDNPFGDMLSILSGRYGPQMQEIIRKEFDECNDLNFMALEYFSAAGDVLLYYCRHQRIAVKTAIERRFASPSMADRLSAASLLLSLCYGFENDDSIFEKIPDFDDNEVPDLASTHINDVLALIDSEKCSGVYRVCGCWTMSWLIRVVSLPSSIVRIWAPKLFEMSFERPDLTNVNHAAWILNNEQFRGQYSKLLSMASGQVEQLLHDRTVDKDTHSPNFLSLVARLAMEDPDRFDSGLVRSFVLRSRTQEAIAWHEVCRDLEMPWD